MQGVPSTVVMYWLIADDIFSLNLSMSSPRSGSRVVQVISRNHSNVSKPAFVISKGLYCSSRNQLSSLFYCLLRHKTKKKVSHLVIPSITQQTQPFLSEFDESPFARFRPFVDTSENNAKKFGGTTGESLYPVGGTGWYMDLVTNHSKPTSLRLLKTDTKKTTGPRILG